MSYAIVECGGKQYKVAVGDYIEVDRLKTDEDEQITLDNVLLYANEEKVFIGTPTIEDATVSATVEKHYKGKKILVFKYISRERYRRRKGHRQLYTRLKIDEISVK